MKFNCKHCKTEKEFNYFGFTKNHYCETCHKLRWPTTVTAKRNNSRQKENAHGKKKKLTAKRKTIWSAVIIWLLLHVWKRLAAIFFPDGFAPAISCGSSVEPNGNFCRNCGKGKLKLFIIAPLLDISVSLRVNPHTHGSLSADERHHKEREEIHW